MEDPHRGNARQEQKLIGTINYDETPQVLSPDAPLAASPHCAYLSDSSPAGHRSRLYIPVINKANWIKSGNNCRSPAMLTSAQSQGTRMASTVAGGRKQNEIKGDFIKPLEIMRESKLPSQFSPKALISTFFRRAGSRFGVIGDLVPKPKSAWGDLSRD